MAPTTYDQLMHVKMSKVFCWPRTGTYPAAACQRLGTSARHRCTSWAENGEAWEIPMQCIAGFVRKRIIKFKTDSNIPERPTVHNIILPPHHFPLLCNLVPIIISVCNGFSALGQVRTSTCWQLLALHKSNNKVGCVQKQGTLFITFFARSPRRLIVQKN